MLDDSKTFNLVYLNLYIISCLGFVYFKKVSRNILTKIYFVHYDNLIVLPTLGNVRSGNCFPDVTYYPFDAQQCELKFASWTTEVTRVSPTNSRDTVLAPEPELSVVKKYVVKDIPFKDQYDDRRDRQEENFESLLTLRYICRFKHTVRCTGRT